MSVERVIRNNVGREKRCFISLSFLFPDVLCATVVYRMLLLQQFRCIEKSRDIEISILSPFFLEDLREGFDHYSTFIGSNAASLQYYIWL